MSTRWLILTGEYPPQHGGVSDYTRVVATGLASSGDRVIIIAPPSQREEPIPEGVIVRRLPDHYGLRSLYALDHELSKQPPPDRILVQYVPHTWGYKGMNLHFAAWLATRARQRAPLWVMFHEVAYPMVRRPIKHVALALVNRLMARWVAHAASRVFVSTLAWVPVLKRIAPRSGVAEWLPVPSNIEPAAPFDIQSVKKQYALPAGRLLCHFGTYGKPISELLKQTIPRILDADLKRAILLLGRNGPEFRERLVQSHVELADRIHATGELAPADISAHIMASDWMYQPYIDGVSTRRTSLMAGLSLGRPVITNTGPLSETIWPSLEGLVLAQSPDPHDLVSSVNSALAMSDSEREVLGTRATLTYKENFSLERTLAILRRSLASTGGSVHPNGAHP